MKRYITKFWIGGINIGKVAMAPMLFHRFNEISAKILA